MLDLCEGLMTTQSFVGSCVGTISVISTAPTQALAVENGRRSSDIFHGPLCIHVGAKFVCYPLSVITCESMWGYTTIAMVWPSFSG